jgi:hypothetical protein
LRNGKFLQFCKQGNKQETFASSHKSGGLVLVLALVSGRTPLTKKAHKKSLSFIELHRAKFNGRPKLPGWPGKRWHSSEPGPGVAFIEGGG